ncbi:VCBS domain-containing protein [Bradyrhizobium sp. AZCC 2289]|uniref:VCBS domain-containing protein n=1 Tax=Bradyrhizobium sp. AZCC 2289 TaxID=3117026 RepID=UPI002FF211A4
MALLPQIIGHIQTAIGCGTLRRANGIAVQVMVGDPVCQGDVIETAADGRIGIRFIDGTVFNLSGGTRVALDEFVCDSSGSSHSALFAVSRGTFGFLAGEVAKTGCLRVETPVGSIRGRAHTGGIGTLSLAALAFSVIKEVQAAESNVTFLDDDNIAYKDMAHGAFELVTKEPIPRHIIVEDPGETIILSPRGSSISVNQVTNSAARMAELQEAQQDVLANFAKGPIGSSSLPFANPLPVQPINFIQTDTSSTQNSLPPLPFLVVPEIIPLRTPPQPPTLNVATGPIEIDTVVFDTFTATSGTFSASSSNSGAILTYGISGGVAGNTVLGGVTYDVSDSGPFGTLYVDSTTGAYTFVPNSGAINALTAPTTESFVITVSDGTLTASQTFTVNINGVNDAAIISGTAAGSVIEAGGAANATPGTPSATGTLTDTDVDNPPNTFTAVNSPTASAGGHGTFTITAAGVWTYTLDNNDGAVQALNAGDTLTDSFTVTTIDGTPQVVTVTIHGSNDAAIISGTTTGSVIEAGDDRPGTPTATGTLTDTDVDNTPNTFTAVSSPTASAGGHGTFTMTAAGVWTYTLNDTDSAVQALNAGDTLTDSFTVTTIDGTPQVVTITIHGSNDAAIISGTVAGSVTEAGGVANTTPGTPIATGTLTDTDVDNVPNTFTPVSAPTASAGGHGTFTMTAAGVWTYTLNNADSAVQALNVGDTLTDSFTVTTVDGTPQMVTVTIHGSNDAAIISGTATGSVLEAGGDSPGTPLATGTLTDTDVDNAPNTFTAVSSPTASDGGYGAFTMTAAGMWTYTLDNNNSVVDALNVGDTLTDTFTVHTADGTAQVVTVTIHGASDADPNDFDNLATGTTVISDPPFVFGTPQHDSIAGGGDVAQIAYGGAGDDTINGTGVNDIIYGGSGNDTIKGNGGDDTIYGGSGSDTINGNNGNDTIIGGFGADLLTGSNGNDRFVYLSVADSHAGQFDTITDFVSGSDKIDLTALGALAFAVLALTSTSTSVPAHTIAWLYDGTSNETIVYVNPTDQTLSIGSSSLLEIHLQGVSTVESSDFVIDPATAPAAVASDAINLDPAATATTTNDGAVVATTSADATSNWTVNDGTLLADGNGTVPTTDVGNNFFADRGWFGSIGYDRFISFGEIQTHATEDANDNAVITLANGQSIVPHNVHVTAPTENHFAFGPTPVLDNVGAITIGDGAAMLLNGAVSNINITAPNAAVDSAEQQHAGNGELIPTNAGTINAAHTHGHTIDTGSSVEHHSEGPEASGNHGLAVAGSIAHSGHPQSDGGSQTVSGEADGHGVAAMHGTGEHNSEASSISDMVFGPVTGGTHGLGDSFHFNSAISASEGPGVINVADLDLTPGSASHHENAAAHGTPMISEEAQTIDASLPGYHSTHIAAPDHAHVSHDLMV